MQVCKCESGQARQQLSHRGDGELVRSLLHAPTVVDQSVRSCASVSRGKHVSNFPIGAMGTFEVSGADDTYPILVDRGSTHYPRRESIWACVSKASHWGNGKFSRSLWHVHYPVVDRSIRSLASASRGKRVSNFPILTFPSGRWELLNLITHNVSCIPVDRGRRYRDRAGRDVDTAALQTTSKT